MAASPNQRGLCSRPPIFIGAMLAMLFVCAVLLKISKERGRQVAELDGLLMESQRTLETTSRDRDLAQLARKETETELEKIRNSKNGVENEKNKLTEELSRVNGELQTCKQDATTARSEKDQLQQSHQSEKENMDKMINELTEQNNRLISENNVLKKDIDKLKHSIKKNTERPTTENVTTANSSNSVKNAFEQT